MKLRPSKRNSKKKIEALEREIEHRDSLGMMIKMRKQHICFIEVSVKELRDNANRLEKELIEIDVDLGIKRNKKNQEKIFNQKCLIGIINKTPKCIDTWKFY